MRSRVFHYALAVAASLSLFCCGTASALDLRQAQVLVDPDLSGPEEQAVTMLVDEVFARTGLTWPVEALELGPVAKRPRIVIRRAKGSGLAEGFHIEVDGSHVEILGNDERGTLFGVGRFLRELRWGHGVVTVADDLDITSAPKYPLRGHQIAYRPKVNTYDAWTPAVFEQYVRDLAAFGTNAIELVPPRSDDDDQSPHFHLPKMEMMVEMSRIIASYGLQVWIWYPAMDRDYTKPETVEFALHEWGEVFRKLPRIDAVFVPGGDPGRARPKVLMELLEKEARLLRQTHPRAQMWISPQNFDSAWLDEFIGVLKREPRWLDGVVYGPWTRETLPKLREMVPQRYPIRRYPDITHSLACEYPVPGWDTASAMTELRETINPRPVDHAKIFRDWSPQTNGFITYSEGVNDDVNKIVWSSLGWNPDLDVTQMMQEYARYFIGPAVEDSFAAGLLSLEQNWRGPLLANALVDQTLLKFQAMERAATPHMLRNWRFQQALYRAYYDAYIHARLIHETDLEQRAMERLRNASRLGSAVAIDVAEEVLDEAVTRPVAQDLRSRISTLAEALFQSIGMQLSVDRYRAIAVSRGANFDTVDFPLNNRHWLKKQFAEIRLLSDENQRLAAIEAIINRANPGPGGFYDDLGNTALQPHLVNQGPGYDQDPGSFRSPRSGWVTFDGGLIGRTSADATRLDGPARFLENPKAWWDFVETRYETPLTLRYDHLDPESHYRIRVVYIGRVSKIRLVADQRVEIHPYIERPAPMRALEFDIPAAATRDGTLTLDWSIEPGQGGFTSSAAVAEVFLIRN